MNSSSDSLERPAVDAEAIRFRAWGLLLAQAIALLGMIGVTWRVWFPDASDDPQEGLPYPAVPLLNALTGVDLRVDWIVTPLTLLLLTCLLISLSKESLERFTGWACAGACLGLLVLVMLNQHRFVPWTYQSLLLFVSYLVLPRETWLRAARWLVVSIYLFSAVSKFDYQFVMTTGRLMFVTGAEMIGLDTSDWSEGSLRLAVLALPLLEFCIGVGLAFRWTRLVAMMAALGMHLSLLLILGPWGLKNAESVLIWNLLFLAQLVLLYWPVKNAQVEGAQESVPVRGGAEAVYVGWVLFFFLVPVLEKFNYADHWPAWGLYSPRCSRCRLWIADWKVKSLPGVARKYVGEKSRSRQEVLREFDLQSWSEDALNLPVYPQDRFQLGVIRYLLKRQDLDRAFRIDIESTSNWLTGKRSVVSLTSLRDLEEFRTPFLLNDRPRN